MSSSMRVQRRQPCPLLRSLSAKRLAGPDELKWMQQEPAPAEALAEGMIVTRRAETRILRGSGRVSA